MTSTVSKGKFAEDLACEFLEKKGYEIIERNFNTPYGEIDIIFTDKDQLVFCEVKSKYTNNSGLPEEEFNDKKLERFNLAIVEYLTLHDINHDNFRIDLIAMQLDQNTRICKVKHYKAYY